MDRIDRLICETVQRDGHASSAAIAEAAGMSTSTANDRLRRLASTGAITGWHAYWTQSAWVPVLPALC
ncbi:MAG: winged helix-turn-helix transcriptional regulator [Pseudomonadota bacterium]